MTTGPSSKTQRLAPNWGRSGCVLVSIKRKRRAARRRRPARGLAPTSIRYDPDVKEFLDRLAEEEERPVGQIVNRALREHFKIPKPAKPKAGKAK
jgi:hypothetical protein